MADWDFLLYIGAINIRSGKYCNYFLKILFKFSGIKITNAQKVIEETFAGGFFIFIIERRLNFFLSKPFRMEIFIDKNQNFNKWFQSNLSKKSMWDNELLPETGYFLNEIITNRSLWRTGQTGQTQSSSHHDLMQPVFLPTAIVVVLMLTKNALPSGTFGLAWARGTEQW